MRSRRAFTLMEVLLALALFSIAILGIVEGIAVQVRTERLAVETTRAVMLAQNIIEEIRYTGDLTVQSRSGEFTGEDIGFAWQYEMKESDVPGLWQIVVVVSWAAGQQDFRLETAVAEARVRRRV